MSALLDASPFVDLPLVRRGKVREVYELGDDLLIIATDRISAFDVVMANGIPDKGRVLNQMSAYWFERLHTICPSHFINADDRAVADRLGRTVPELAGRCTIARRTEPLTIECIARGYLTGSLYKEYVASGGSVHGLAMPSGLLDGSQLPAPIFTPATKATTGHDENISFDEAAEMVGLDTATKVRDWTLRLYKQASQEALLKGIILADTKFEFGRLGDQLLLIDEALTPDSSRYWPQHEWVPGRAQPSYDKQFVRDYLESISFNKQPPGPVLPDDVVSKTRDKYLQAFRLLTGRELAVPTGAC